MALVIALALMTGLQSELRDRILGSTAHVFVFKQPAFRTTAPRSRRCARFRASSAPRPRSSGARWRRRQGADAFISFKGIDPALEATVTDIEKSIVSGKLTDLNPRNEDELRRHLSRARISRSSSA